MGLLSKEAILAAQDLPTEDVAVPEWGGTVRVRGMTGAERDAWEAGTITPELLRAFKEKGAAALAENVRARLVAATVVGEDGKLLFSAADVAALGAKSAIALDRVFAVAQRLCAFNQKDLEELGKVFAAMLGGGSTSTSQGT